MASSFTSGYSDNSMSYFSFDVSSGDSKGGVGSSINQIFSHKDDCWIDGGSFCVIL